MSPISTITRKLNKGNWTTVISVVFISLGIAINVFAIDIIPIGAASEPKSVFGGRDDSDALKTAVDESVFIESPFAIDEIPVAGRLKDAPVSILEGQAVLVGASSPLSNIVPGRNGIFVYKIQKGDSLGKIAVNFDISLNTILWANKELKKGYIVPGQEIIILPVSGILHQVREGETIDALASLYGVSKDDIVGANIPEVLNLTAGSKIIVPGGKPKRDLAPILSENLPAMPGYFGLPAAGKNWGQLHPNNAVDIANACGTPVYAAAEGLITETGSPKLSNKGLGGFIEIQHPNGTGTVYAHLEKIIVQPGDYIERGAKIGEIGNTGNVIGSAGGCHLHFEVRGAQNPLAK